MYHYACIACHVCKKQKLSNYADSISCHHKKISSFVHHTLWQISKAAVTCGLNLRTRMCVCALKMDGSDSSHHSINIYIYNANMSISTCSSVSILNAGYTLAVVMLRNMMKLVCLKLSCCCSADLPAVDV
jgi:hypothetical protein